MDLTDWHRDLHDGRTEFFMLYWKIYGSSFFEKWQRSAKSQKTK